MSSWIVAKSRPTKVKPSVSKYHEVSLPNDIYTVYMELIASYVYCQKMGETCNVWDQSGIVRDTLRNNPQVKVLKEKPDEVQPLTLQTYKEIVSKMDFKDIQKMASGLIIYEPALNNTVAKFLEKAGIKTSFDIGFQLNKDPAGPNLGLMKKYAALIKAYQTKSKKEKLNVYIMSNDYMSVTQFQTYCDPSWKITSLSKTQSKDPQDAFVQSLAEVFIMSSLQSLVLDFNNTGDRFIFLMNKTARMEYFVEVNSAKWSLLP